MTVFSCLTIGVKDNMIYKNISLYKKCRYNSTSLNNFRELFRVAFIDDSPKVIIGNSAPEKDLISFDRKSALNRALRYLNMRGINTCGIDELDQQVQCEYVYGIFSKYILPAIMSNNNGLSIEEAENEDITELMMYAISQTFREHGRIASINFEILYNKQNTIEDTMLDKSKPTYPIEVDSSNNKCYEIVKNFYNLSVYFVIKENKETDMIFDISSDIDKNKFLDSLLINIDDSFAVKLAFRPIFYFDKSNEFYNLNKWEYISNIDESKMMSDKHGGLWEKIGSYYDSLGKEACKHIEEQLRDALTPYYEHLCDELELMLENLISLNISSNEKANISNYELPDEKTLIAILTEKAEKLIFDFEIVNHFLMKYRKDDYVNALFIMLQNIVCDITDFLNDKGANLSETLSVILSKERFKEHIQIMKRRLNSNNLKYQKELEVRLYNERKCEYKKPESVRDILFSKRPFVYSGLHNAIAKYIDQLNHVTAKNNDSD